MFVRRRNRTYQGKKCDRCGLYNPVGLETCDHCQGLSDFEIMQATKRSNKDIKKIGRLMLYMLVMLVFVTLILLQS